MNEKERVALTEKVQKRVKEKHPHFQLIKRRDEIEKEFEVKNKDGRY